MKKKNEQVGSPNMKKKNDQAGSPNTVSVRNFHLCLPLQNHLELALTLTMPQPHIQATSDVNYETNSYVNYETDSYVNHECER